MGNMGVIPLWRRAPQTNGFGSLRLRRRLTGAGVQTQQADKPAKAGKLGQALLSHWPLLSGHGLGALPERQMTKIRRRALGCRIIITSKVTKITLLLIPIQYSLRDAKKDVAPKREQN